jgi:hypothetical protein
VVGWICSSAPPSACSARASSPARRVGLPASPSTIRFSTGTSAAGKTGRGADADASGLRAVVVAVVGSCCGDGDSTTSTASHSKAMPAQAAAVT